MPDSAIIQVFRVSRGNSRVCITWVNSTINNGMMLQVVISRHFQIYFKFWPTLLLKNQFFSHLMILQPPHAVYHCTLEAQLLC